MNIKEALETCMTITNPSLTSQRECIVQLSHGFIKKMLNNGEMVDWVPTAFELMRDDWHVRNKEYSLEPFIHNDIKILVRDIKNNENIPTEFLPNSMGGDDKKFLQWYCPDITDDDFELINHLLFGKKMSEGVFPRAICEAFAMMKRYKGQGK